MDAKTKRVYGVIFGVIVALSVGLLIKINLDQREAALQKQAEHESK